MHKKIGMLASFLLLSAVTLVGVGCSDNRQGYTDNSDGYYEQGYQQPVYSNENVRLMPASYADSTYQEASAPCAPPCPAPCAPACQAPCAPVCPPICAPACPPVCAPPACPPVCMPEPVCCPPAPACVECKPLVRCKHPNRNELQCFDFITVTARNPRMCLLGENYPLDFDVKACDDVCDVVVTTHLPDGVSLISSDPEAIVEGNKLTWNIGSMSKGECRPARVMLKCECEGELCACFCATATPVRFCALLCAKPILTCEKTGPCTVCPGDPVHYTITVSNHGSCAAEDVLVSDNLPPEVEHSSGLRTLNIKLGTLQPCETKTVNICTTAVKRSKNACNTVTVTACNADTVACQWCTCICCCDMRCSKVGPKEVPIGKNADYQITVENTGDILLTDVVVTDNAPSSTSIVAANGACINGNQAVWRLRELKPGDRATFNLTLTTCVPGCFTNKVHVTNCQQCNGCCEATTRWKGRPALTFCIRDTENPICIGERTSYLVDITNQGSETDSNVQLVLRFPKEVAPLSASGDSPANVSGQTVTFKPYPTLRPRQTITYRVDAEAKASGDGRVVAEVSSDSVKTPIMQQESTIVN